jgi:hypothetical protein
MTDSLTAVCPLWTVEPLLGMASQPAASYSSPIQPARLAGAARRHSCRSASVTSLSPVECDWIPAATRGLTLLAQVVLRGVARYDEAKLAWAAMDGHEQNKAVVWRFVDEVSDGGNIDLLDDLCTPGGGQPRCPTRPAERA